MSEPSGFPKIGAYVEKLSLACLLIGMTIIVSLGVVTRYLFGFSFSWIEELPRYCLVWITFLGAAALMRDGVNHPRVIMLIGALPKGAQRYVLIAENLIMMAILIVMAQGAIIMIRINSAQVSPALEIPMYFIYLIIPLSALIGIVRLAFDMWRLLTAREEGIAPTADKYF